MGAENFEAGVNMHAGQRLAGGIAQRKNFLTQRDGSVQHLFFGKHSMTPFDRGDPSLRDRLLDWSAV